MLTKILKREGRLLISILNIVFILMSILFPRNSDYFTGLIFLMFAIWAFTIGEELVIKSKKYFEYSIYKYKVFLWFLISPILISFLIMPITDPFAPLEPQSTISLLMIPFSIIYSYLYVKVLYIVSKSVVSLENNKEAEFKLVFGTFIQMILFGVTSWFLLGRVQRIMNNSDYNLI